MNNHQNFNFIKHHFLYKSLILFLFLLSVNANATPNIAVSINPLYSLTKEITQGVLEPKLILKNNQSSHHFHLLPSQISLINNADLIIFINYEFEQGLQKILSNISDERKMIVNDNNGNDHDHDNNHKDDHESDHDNDNDHENAHDNDHKDDHESDHDNDHENAHDNDHKDEHDNVHNNDNHHIWLDVNKMQIFIKKLLNKLSKIDPENQQKYLINFKKTDRKLQLLKETISKNNSSTQSSKVVVFSNAFEHFLKANNINYFPPILKHHEEKMSIYKMLQAKKIIQTNKVKCLIASEAIKLKQIKGIIADMDINFARIDMVKDSNYFNLMRNISSKISECYK